MEDSLDDFLAHYGTPRKSGRYPWGSGGNGKQRNKEFLDYVADLEKQGLSRKLIADGLGLTTTQLVAARSIAKSEYRNEQANTAFKLKEKGMSNVAIGQQMGINESSVRSLLNPSAKERNDILANTANVLKEQVANKTYLDIGAGTENHMGVSPDKLRAAVASLQNEGYKIHYVKVEQQGTGKQTTIKVLTEPDVSYGDVFRNQGDIKSVAVQKSDDGGRTMLGLETPKSVSSSRVAIRYAEEGGADADGVIYLRRGVDDISLGGKLYAQVRIAVDDTHYIKGMAIYRDDLPDGVDLQFNTNKSNTGNKKDALKALKDDPDNPFGSVVSQRKYTDKDGKQQLSSINIVNEEGDWHTWSKNLSSQMVSKQTPALAKQQLDLFYKQKEAEYDEIMSLTNPAVRKMLLEKFADGADSSAVKLSAAGLPRTRNHVIIPVNSLKDNEIFAPNYRDGENVVLIRHPHGGTFEIPELRVNNNNKEARSMMGGAIDAVGINSKVAQRLSGADFDGDTVLVIPNKGGQIKTSPALKELQGFDPQSYKLPADAPRMSPASKQKKMGDVSNLITDMTVKGAPMHEIARAVKHSMVVIDAEKHHLDWKRSAEDNGINALKAKYQEGGASTLISRAKSDLRVDERTVRKASDGGPVNKQTGEKMYTPTGASFTNSKGQVVKRTTVSTRMAEAKDAHTLSSGTRMEKVYADHANKLKNLGNQARLQAVNTKNTPYSPSAKALHSKEVASLNAKLNVAIKNKPYERQAQLLANTVVSAKRQANPGMDKADLKKIKGQALTEARNRVGAKKDPVQITPSEWNAIQAGAISTSKLKQILDNANLDQIKTLATPRNAPVMTSAVTARAKAMLSAGYTQAEIADALGIPTSTLNSSLLNEGS